MAVNYGVLITSLTSI